MKLFKELKWYFIQEWKRYTGTFVLLTIMILLQLLPSKIIGNTIDLILNHQSSNQEVLLNIIQIVIISIAVYLLRYFWRILLFGASNQLTSQLREKFCFALLQQDTKFYSKYSNGDLISRATNDIDRIVFATGEGILTIIDSFVLGCSIIIVMCIQTNWKLSFFSLTPMPIMAIMIKRYGKLLYIKFKKSQKYFSYLNSQAQDSLSNINMIRNFGLETAEIKKFSIVAKNVGKKDFQVSKLDAQLDPIIHISVALSNLFAILGGSFLITKNQLTFGQLTSFILYLGSMIWPILAFAWMFNILERGNVSWQRIKKILCYNVKKNIPSNIMSINSLKDLTINIKTFSFPKRKNSLLHDVKVLIPRRTTLGICGPTGSGKTTLIRLIQQHFILNNGYIHYQKYNIKDIYIKEWRKTISVVNQIPFLFSDSILKNIAFGKKNATFKEIKNAAKLACIHDDIKKLPYGYYTKIGEKGIKLSGGQKQRITIARAFLAPSKILILDDPLSSVDHDTEHRIIKNIHQYTQKNKITTIIATHRLSILEKFNNIIVLKNGTIVQQGSHKKLLSSQNWYSKMYNYQKFK
ncbi:Multidrug resistance-like ATP-binding protein MdlA [Buchnera aphidicola (Cinara kochiana kochiana)]|uniref:Multidrug resistance-like ATP-binding protein MdlA n=1 Tax=Buchnera aphidicola (Cinara kochiana kochiana) TaxID=2518976 RepID=A0A451D5S7_9GAMM|nr:ABC transporter transmembrane domain-containing protein [Buchnera aphidicola]VFP81210.1 Multidrug resistance-like ATP-binding protein MdlA [Buchnera aphidicola (Cinara kochiana kochiana)]